MSAPSGGERGFEDVRYYPTQTSQNVPAIIEGGRAPSLLADSIQPVVVLGDGKGTASNSNAVTEGSFSTGALVFGSTTIGSPYFEFHAQKAPASGLARKLLSGLAGFLDSFIGLPLFSITASPGTAATADRVVIVRDVSLSIQLGGGTGPQLAVWAAGFFETANPTFRTSMNPVTTTPGAQGNNLITPRSAFTAGQLANNVPDNTNGHVLWHDDALTGYFNTVNLGEGIGIIRPFQHLVPFFLGQDQGFFVGQTDFGSGSVGTLSQFAVNVIWSEVPTGTVS